MVQISRSKKSSSRAISIVHIFLTFMLCAFSFYTGTLSATSSDCSSSHFGANDGVGNSSTAQNVDATKIEAIVQQRLQAELSKASGGSKKNSAKTEGSFFTKSTDEFLVGVTRVNKDSFVEKFDSGNPMYAGKQKNGEVLLFYNTPKALPTSEDLKYQAMSNNGSGIGLMDVSTATENCDTMNVVQTGRGNTRQCLAIVGDFESYHVQRWMRTIADADLVRKLNRDEPLRQIGRGNDAEGHNPFQPPHNGNIKTHQKFLQKFLETYDDKIAELKVIATKVAVKNTIIVMTCNFGQSELLMNFVCNAKSKGLNISNILVFPTDEETKELAESLGLATYYDKEAFGDTPSSEAQHYGDRAFVAMMLAKVLCVQLINHMGYDLLFQDVDIVWYKDPLEYFHDDNNPLRDFDMYFQDDGARSSRFAPLSANTGFYFVRSNSRTNYLFQSLLYNSDQIIQSHSHQEALVQTMNEHISLFGLRVKTLSRDMDEFPGGWHYHRKNKDFMMKLVKEEVSPIIFHMSWTKNKINKIKFYQQMGQWYVNDMCIAHTKPEIMGNHDMKEGESIADPCCLSEPNLVCHYRDKPSKIPCREMDPIDAGRPSFW